MPALRFPRLCTLDRSSTLRRPFGGPGRALAVALALALAGSAAAPTLIRIRPGDTLSELARKHHTTVAALRELNDLPGTLIIAGRTLRIPGPPPKARPRTRLVHETYVVRRGDSLIGISRRFGVRPSDVAARNRLPRSLVVVLGQRLVIRTKQVAVAPPPRPRPRGPERVSKATALRLLVRESRRVGLDPNLALGLATMESGLQQHVVSSAGAIGVMQVMPGTGQWVSRYVVRRNLDLHRVEDNITAGVAYLRLLLDVARSKEEALAGYYQGLASVRQRGPYRQTTAYVANVLALQRLYVRRGTANRP